MSWSIVNLNHVHPSPWRNGGGVTRELVTWPNAEHWVWRMSVAEITQNGPFSRFEGVQRWFAVLSGTGVRLTLGQHTHDLSPQSAPLCFDGETAPDCHLTNGPTQDFNLMLRRSQASARMVRLKGSLVMHTISSKTIAAYAIDTGVSVHFDHEVLSLPAATLAWRQCPAGTHLQMVSDHALWMEIEP